MLRVGQVKSSFFYYRIGRGPHGPLPSSEPYVTVLRLRRTFSASSGSSISKGGPPRAAQRFASIERRPLLSGGKRGQQLYVLNMPSAPKVQAIFRQIRIRVSPDLLIALTAYGIRPAPDSVPGRVLIWACALFYFAPRIGKSWVI